MSSGSRISRGGASILFGQIFAENCMKMKEIGPMRHMSLAPFPPDPPLKLLNYLIPVLMYRKLNSEECRRLVEFPICYH